MLQIFDNNYFDDSTKIIQHHKQYQRIWQESFHAGNERGQGKP